MGSPTLLAGTRVLIGRRNSVYRNGKNRWENDILSATVVSAERDRVELVDESGQSRVLAKQNAYSNINQEPDGTTLLWTAPLPNGADAAARNFCQVALDAGSDMGLFHVVSADGGSVVARIVMDRPVIDEESFDIRCDVDELDTAHRVIEFEDQGEVKASKDIYPVDLDAAEVRPGELIAARSYVASIVDGVPTLCPKDWLIVGNFQDLEAIGTFLPPQIEAPEGAFVTRGSRFGSVGSFQQEIDLAWASTEPDEAVVLITESERGRAGTMLSQRGRVLFRWDDAIHCLEDQAPGPGLWIAHDLTGWSTHHYEFGYDSGIDADWRPFAPADIEVWGWTVEDLDRHIHENLEDGSAIEGTAERQMAQAEAGILAEAASTAP